MYSEVLIAKYGGSSWNNVHTVCLANFASLPAKVAWLTKFFLKNKVILYGFCVSHWPANLGVSTWVVFNITASRLNIYFRIGVYMSIKIL